MKTSATVSLAVMLLALPFPVLAQAGNKQDTAPGGRREAMRMVPARGALLETLDAKRVKVGDEFRVRLSKAVQLDNGPGLPVGTILVGNIADDDMQISGMSKLVLRFTHANLQNGQLIPLKATIVNIVRPESVNDEGYPVVPGDQVPNSWNDGTLQVEEIGVVPGVDLHSKIASTNSGVLASTTKDDVKLAAGSEIQMALAVGSQSTASRSNGARKD